ncbi:hypothetical protein IMZ48_21550 [Candidatus Bathyarchaeota archaeon]|nr:hypothetical protein [Candidatus Bathyarchaeota archaeon]
MLSNHTGGCADLASYECQRQTTEMTVECRVTSPSPSDVEFFIGCGADLSVRTLPSMKPGTNNIWPRLIRPGFSPISAKASFQGDKLPSAEYQVRDGINSTLRGVYTRAYMPGRWSLGFVLHILCRPSRGLT